MLCGSAVGRAREAEYDGANHGRIEFAPLGIGEHATKERVRTKDHAHSPDLAILGNFPLLSVEQFRAKKLQRSLLIHGQTRPWIAAVEREDHRLWGLRRDGAQIDECLILGRYQ